MELSSMRRLGWLGTEERREIYNGRKRSSNRLQQTIAGASGSSDRMQSICPRLNVVVVESCLMHGDERTQFWAVKRSKLFDLHPGSLLSSTYSILSMCV